MSDHLITNKHYDKKAPNMIDRDSIDAVILSLPIARRSSNLSVAFMELQLKWRNVENENQIYVPYVLNTEKTQIMLFYVKTLVLDNKSFQQLIYKLKIQNVSLKLTSNPNTTFKLNVLSNFSSST